MRPAPKRRGGPLAYLFLAVALCWLLYVLWQYPLWTLGAFGLLSVATVIVSRKHKATLSKQMAERPREDDICLFARSFDLREVDSWVVRAVYEELKHHLRAEGLEVAIRADDDIIKDLGINPDDLDMAIAVDIAARTGRSFEGYRTNPYYDITNTARGLVLFFNAQPRVA